MKHWLGDDSEIVWVEAALEGLEGVCIVVHC